MEMKDRERHKTQQKHMMLNRFAHHTLKNDQPIPEQQSATLSKTQAIYKLSMMSCGIEYPFGQFWIPVLAMLPPDLGVHAHQQSMGT